MIKIAAVTDNGKRISAHFGRARKVAVLTVEDGLIIERELRDKVDHDTLETHEAHGHEHHERKHGRGHGHHAAEKHQAMFEAFLDCEVILARGMGDGAYQALKRAGIRPILTDIAEIEPAVQAVIDGSIKDHPERRH